MKNKELKDLFQGLSAAMQYEGVGFAVWLGRNMKKIEAELQLWEDSIKPSKELQAIDKKRDELLKKYSKKDEKTGKPLIQVHARTGQTMYSLDDVEGYNKEYQEWKELPENKDLYEAQDKKQKEYEELLEKDVLPELEKKLIKIAVKDLPSNIKGDITYLIMPLIKDTEE